MPGEGKHVRVAMVAGSERERGDEGTGDEAIATVSQPTFPLSVRVLWQAPTLRDDL